MESPSDNPGESLELEPFIPKGELFVPPGFSLEVSAAEAHSDLQAISRDRAGSYSSSYSRTREMEESIDPVTRANTELQLTSGQVAGLVLLESDPLEEYRHKAGLTEKRNQLTKELQESYSFENGIRLLNLAFGGERNYTSMDDVNKDFPDITKFELTLFSLLKRFPNFMIDRYPSVDKKTDDLMRGAVAYVGGVSQNGIEVRLDVQRQTDQDKMDSIINRGMTGVSLDPFSEDVDFSPKVKKLLNELIPLTVTNQRLFERIWDNFEVSLQDGFVKIDKLALEKIIGRSLSPDEKMSDVIAALGVDERRGFEKEKKEMDINFGQNIVVDPMKQTGYEPHELVRLVGLLRDTPDILFGKEPFEGFVIPYGTGMLFTDKTGKKDFFPFHSHYIREELQGLYYESDDTSKYNQVLSLLFSDIKSNIAHDIEQQMEEDGKDPSILEGMQFDAKLRYNLDFNKGVSNPYRSKEWIDVFGAAKSRDTLAKIGTDEMSKVIALVRLVPPEFLEKVKGFEKNISSSMDFMSLLNGMIEAGSYDRLTQTISLNQPEFHPFGAQTDEERAIYSFTVLHEIAHGVWQMLDQDMISEWRNISSAQGIHETPESSEFLTTYSRKSRGEDFAEHMAAYIFHGEEFRNKADSDPNLSLKYQFMKNVFQNIAGNVREYPQISPFTFDQLHIYSEDFAKEQELETVAVKLNKMEESMELAARGKSNALFADAGGNESHDVLDPEEREDAIRDEPVDSRIDVDSQIGYKREAVEDFVDFFSAGDTEEMAEKRAKKLYKIIEDDDLEDALDYAEKYCDPDDWSEVEERIRGIYEDISTGNDFVKDRLSF